MVKSPKTGRDLEGTRVYYGPRWLAEFVRSRFGTEPDENEAES